MNKANDVALPLKMCVLQDNNERDYAIDSFWLQNLNFKQRIDNLTFSSLFEVRDVANALFNLALEFNLGDKIKNDFMNKIKFINYLLENLGHGDHRVALQRLKDNFGGKKGMSSKSQKQADKIIRESLKLTSGPIYSHPHQPQFNGPMAALAMPLPLAPFGMPQLPHPSQNFANPGRGTNGPCFNCQQHGHVARFCPNGQRQPRGGGGNRRGGGSGGRGSQRKFFGRKKG